MRSVLRRALLALAALSISLHAADSEAATKRKSKASAAARSSAKKSVALGTFTGTGSKEVRGWVSAALGDEASLVVTDAEDFKPKNTAAGYEKMASDLGVEAVIVGKVEKQRLVLSVRGSDGEVMKEIVVKAARGPKLRRAVESGLAPAIASTLGVTETEEPAEEEPAEEPAAAEAPAEDEEAAAEDEAADEELTEEEGEGETGEEEQAQTEGATGPTGPSFVATLGVRFLNRKLTFNDTLTQLNPDRPLGHPAFVMRDYELRLDPVIFLNLQIYPGAMFGSEGFASNIGIVGAFEQGIPIDSNYAGDLEGVPPTLKNNLQEWYAGLRVRFPGESSEVGVAMTYGQHKFYLEGDELNPIVPDTAYSYLRVGGDAWVSFGSVFAGLEVGLRAVLGAGELETLWFKSASGKGIDAGVRLGYEISDSISLLLMGDVVRYGFNFNPIDRSTATRVAGGAIDQYLSGSFAVRFALDGASSKGFGLNSASVSVSSDAEAEEDAAAEEDAESEEDAEAEEDAAAEEDAESEE